MMRKVTRAMKTNGQLIIMTAILAGFISCSKQELPSIEKDSAFTLTLGMPENSVVKTTLGPTDGNKYPIYWKTGDKVSVNGIVSNGLPEGYNDKARANFSFASELSLPYYILYPAQIGKTNEIVVPATQTYVAGSFDPAAAPLYGYSASKSDCVELHNLTGTVCLSLKGTDKLTRIELTSNSGQALAGKVTLATGQSGFTGAFSVTEATSTVTLSFGSGLQLGSSATKLFIPVLAQAYTGGFTANVYNETGRYMSLKFWNAGKTVKGTELYSFEDKDYEAGRTESLQQIEDMTVEEDHFETHITVGSYNIWSSAMRQKYYDDRNDPSGDYYFSGDGAFVDNDPRLWDNSKNYVAKAIVDCGYDVFGVVEAYSSAMREDIKTAVASAGGSYTWKFFKVDSEDGSQHAMAYNHNVFEPVGDGGIRWLTNIDGGKKENRHGVSFTTNPTNYYNWEEGTARAFSYQFFKHKATGKTIMFCVCHAPLNDEWNTYAGNNYITKYVNEINTSGYPVIFVGDLNSCPNGKKNGNGEMYQKLLDKGWKHAWKEAQKNGVLDSAEEEEYPCTWEGQRGQISMLKSADHPFKHQIDHIFYSSGLKVTNYWGNRFRHKEAYPLSSTGFRQFFPSDHIPVVAEFSF